jgi:hypothetical protein
MYQGAVEFEPYVGHRYIVLHEYLILIFVFISLSSPIIIYL